MVKMLGLCNNNVAATATHTRPPDVSERLSLWLQIPDSVDDITAFLAIFC